MYVSWFAHVRCVWSGACVLDMCTEFQSVLFPMVLCFGYVYCIFDTCVVLDQCIAF